MADRPAGTWRIYKVTSRTSGKSYIGLTAQSTQRRWNSHLHNARRRRPGAGCAILPHALLRYGAADFVVETIATASSLEQACDLERRLIAEHGTLAPEGYNVALGGAGCPGVSRPMSAETKAKIGAGNRGVPKSEEGRRNIAAAAPGRVITEERRQQMRQVSRENGLRSRGNKRTETVRLLGQIRRKEEALRRCEIEGRCAGLSFEQARWRVRTSIDGKRREIGSFDAFDEAKQAYIAAVNGHLTFLRAKLLGQDLGTPSWQQLTNTPEPEEKRIAQTARAKATWATKMAAGFVRWQRRNAGEAHAVRSASSGQ